VLKNGLYRSQTLHIFERVFEAGMFVIPIAHAGNVSGLQLLKCRHEFIDQALRDMGVCVHGCQAVN
jgi:hypothetical protein